MKGLKGEFKRRNDKSCGSASVGREKSVPRKKSEIGIRKEKEREILRVSPLEPRDCLRFCEQLPNSLSITKKRASSWYLKPKMFDWNSHTK